MENTRKRFWVWILVFWIPTQCFHYQFFGTNLSIDVGIKINPDRLVFLLLLIVFFFHWATGSTTKKKINTVEIMMTIFTLVITLSLVVSGADEVEVRNRWLTTVFNLSYFPFLTYFMVRRMDLTNSETNLIFKSYVFIGFYLALNGLLEHYNIDSLVWPSYITDPSIGKQWGRLRGSFGNPTALGGALVTILSIALVFLDRRKGFGKIFISTLVILLCVTIYFSYTRSIWISMAGVLLGSFLFQKGMRPFLRTIAILMLFTAILGVTSKLSIGNPTLFSRRSETVDYRLVNYMTSLNMIREHPIVGIGYGRFLLEWERYFENRNIDISNLGDGNHNLFLGIFAESGIVAFAPYVIIFAMNLYTIYKVKVSSPTDPPDMRTDTALAALFVLCAFVLMGQTSDLRFHQFYNNSLFLLLGMVSAFKDRIHSTAVMFHDKKT